MLSPVLSVRWKTKQCSSINASASNAILAESNLLVCPFVTKKQAPSSANSLLPLRLPSAGCLRQVCCKHGRLRYRGHRTDPYGQDNATLTHIAKANMLTPAPTLPPRRQLKYTLWENCTWLFKLRTHGYKITNMNTDTTTLFSQDDVHVMNANANSFQGFVPFK